VILHRIAERVAKVLEIEPDEVLSKEGKAGEKSNGKKLILFLDYKGIWDIPYRIGWKTGNEYLLHGIYS
jgi:hypothetical protein